ncbi:hypothetical protein [Larsenimonas rhizosphaerae]|uniref:hypothetical protein n=1 Tax=Larsenimonas rhizosphaerae TaxID=2944682 RepID=UPI0020347046|nr:hypothetical protein [Larsenimonas rhizosphaerae]MCM2131462.1 hypothetical protein [Larsenimonas rhizosphaerae]
MDYQYSASTGCFYDGAHPSIPDDAVGITRQKRDELIAAQAEGCHITADKNGRPVAIRLEFTAGQQRQNALDWLDATADRVRASDRSVGQYLDAEYQLVAQALIEYRNNPEGEVPDAIQSYAIAEGLTVEDAAQQIAEAAARAQELLQDVRRIRLAGKAAVRDADTDDFFNTAQQYVEQLERQT